MKYFSFQIFYNETKFIKKIGHNVVATKKTGVGYFKQFVLRNKKTIIHKGNDKNWDFEIF